MNIHYEKRVAEALESIAKSLEEIANPTVYVSPLDLDVPDYDYTKEDAQAAQAKRQRNINSGLNPDAS